MASMTDVIFLLLIFFMITSTVVSPNAIKVLLPQGKQHIEYNGEEQNVNVFWDVEEFLYAGNYRVDIFEGGNLIGSQTFTLD